MTDFAKLLVQLRGEESKKSASRRIGIGDTYLAALEVGIDKRSGKPCKPSRAVLEQIALAYEYDYRKLMIAAGLDSDPEYNDTLIGVFQDNLDLQEWYINLPKHKEKDLLKLKAVWDIMIQK
ncbi:MAG: hypothetical protein ABS948_12085 [Solibacillus sp.]